MLGHKYCPEDFEDWTKLAVTIDGIYSLPAKLMSSVVAPEEGCVAVCPESGKKREGHIEEEHPFSYHLRCMNASFDDGKVFNPPREEEEGRRMIKVF
jgi:hypothetical protein